MSSRRRSSRLGEAVDAENRPGGGATIATRASTISFDASSSTGELLPGPADLLAAALAACILKNVERFSGLLPFRYERAQPRRDRARRLTQRSPFSRRSAACSCSQSASSSPTPSSSETALRPIQPTADGSRRRIRPASRLVCACCSFGDLREPRAWARGERETGEETHQWCVGAVATIMGGDSREIEEPLDVALGEA